MGQDTTDRSVEDKIEFQSAWPIAAVFATIFVLCVLYGLLT